MPYIALTDADLERIGRLTDHDIARLYQHLTNRLRATRRLETPNANVVTIRLPPDVLDRVKALAVRQQITRSHLVREAVNDFVRRHPV